MLVGNQRPVTATKTVKLPPETLRRIALHATELWQAGPAGNDYLYDIYFLVMKVKADGRQSPDPAELVSVADSYPAPRKGKENKSDH